MELAIGQLKIGFKKGYIDGPYLPKNLLGQEIKYKPIIGGDKIFPCISAASIIAKVYRDRLMSFLDVKFPMYGWKKNAGYGTKQHIDSINTTGITSFHRKTFEPIKSLVQN